MLDIRREWMDRGYGDGWLVELPEKGGDAELEDGGYGPVAEAIASILRLFARVSRRILSFSRAMCVCTCQRTKDKVRSQSHEFKTKSLLCSFPFLRLSRPSHISLTESSLHLRSPLRSLAGSTMEVKARWALAIWVSRSPTR